MLSYDLRCNICSTSEHFCLNVPRGKIFKHYHHIKKNYDICPLCASKILLNEEYVLQNDLIIRDLTKQEIKLIINFLKNN
jgi:hypothetical protein